MNQLTGGDEPNDAIVWPVSLGRERRHGEVIAEGDDLLLRKTNPLEKLAADAADRQHECKSLRIPRGEPFSPEPLEPACVPRLLGGLGIDREPGLRGFQLVEAGPDERMREEASEHVERVGAAVACEGGVVGRDRDVYDCDTRVNRFAPALGDSLWRHVLLDGEDHFARKLFSNGFEERFLMRAGEGLPEDDAINFQGLSPDGSCMRTK